MKAPIRAARRAVLRAAFALLYGPGALTYEVVSAVGSLGEWSAWRRSALGLVRGSEVLELGFGTGRLIPELAHGRRYTGLDPAPWMHRQTRAWLRRTGGPSVRLVRGRAEALPFREASFDSLVATFPTAYILDPRAHAEIRRVLRPGGRLVVVAEAALRRVGPMAALANWALALSGDGSAPPLADALRSAGFSVSELAVQHPRSSSAVILAERPRPDSSEARPGAPPGRPS